MQTASFRFWTQLSDGEVPIILELWGAEYPFIAIAPRSTLDRNGSTWYGPIYVLNRTKPWFQEFTVFAFKLGIYAKLNYLK